MPANAFFSLFPLTFIFDFPTTGIFYFSMPVMSRHTTGRRRRDMARHFDYFSLDILLINVVTCYIYSKV